MAALVGLRDFHAAKLMTDSSTGATYEEPQLIAGAINATITPTVNSETLFADDGPQETMSTLGEIAIELQLAELTLSAQAMLLGHTLVNGTMVRKEGDIAPYVALGFRSKKSNGKYRYLWLYKGKFAVPEQEFATQTDTPQYNTGTISASFVKRIFDDAWEIEGDEDDPEFDQSSTWFDSVVQPPTPEPPGPPAFAGTRKAPQTLASTPPPKEAKAGAEN